MALAIPVLLTFAMVYLISRLVYKYIIQPAFLSPLSKIPSAHPTSPILPLWFWYAHLTGHENRTVYAIHRRLGPVVRVAPNEVSINTLEGLKKIYIGGFDRTDWFKQFQCYDGAPNLVTLLGGKRHAAQRKMITNVYSKSYILGSEDFHKLSRIILEERLFPLIDKAARKGEAVDVFELGGAVSVEFISAYELGIENGYDFLGDDKAAFRKKHIDDGMKRASKLDQKATKRLENEFMEMCWKTEDVVARREADSKETGAAAGGETTYPVVFAQMRNAILQKGEDLSKKELLRLVACEIFDHLEAARGAMSITILYVIHNLSKRPEMQEVLRKELATLDPPLILPFNERTLSTEWLRKLDSLDLLEGITMETLRVNAPTPGPQRRAVPPEGVTIEGYFIPGGTTIFSSAICLHHHEAAFPDPDAWKPERWMKSASNTGTTGDDAELGKGKPEDDPRRWFWAFGSGGKMCIGNHFAIIGK